MKILKVFTSDLPKNEIYNAWVSEQMLINPISKIECNPVKGGVFNLTFSYDGGRQSVMNGIFQKVVKYNLLEYTWKWGTSDEQTLVTVKFKQNDNKTFVSLIHEGFLTEQSKISHEKGWENYFDMLEKKVQELKFQANIKKNIETNEE